MRSGATNITIIAVGKVRDRALRSKIDEYAERIRHEGQFQIVEARDFNDKEREGKKIGELLRKRKGIVVALGEEGVEFSSEKFARTMIARNRDMVFVIGGHLGLSDKVKQDADHLLSMSAMTLTHEMAQLLLVEQIYRAVTILLGKKYHRG